MDREKVSTIIAKKLTAKNYSNPLDIIKKYSKSYQFSRAEIINTYINYCNGNNISVNKSLIEKIKLKPTRTISGVVPITVLTKPFPCPGRCIFCPNDVMMPKSYLSLEPGAQRALMNKFDPYLQVKNRLQAMQNIGHTTEKLELLILGGTWSVYPRPYQEWFIKRCIQAMNEFEYKKETKYKYTKNKINFDTTSTETDPPENWNIDELLKTQDINSTARYRCIGITLETRPDRITEGEAIHLRKIGGTRIQLGIQSTDDLVLEKNKRGETSKNQKRAISILRRTGFKIQIHWMPNLYGSSPKKDKKDIRRIYKDENYMPDEIKIYPCSIIETAELYDYWKAKKYNPYTEEELIEVLIYAKSHVKEFSRINRLIRDIPSTYIVDGNKKTNLRQVIQEIMKKRGKACRCIRCNEIKTETINKIYSDIYRYNTSVSIEYFLTYKSNKKILGFLRLSIPKDSKEHFIEELRNSAIIREVHVYGRSLAIGEKTGGAQHIGLGTKLIKRAERIAKQYKIKKLAVISSIGTREYYKKKGFEQKSLYQIKEIK